MNCVNLESSIGDEAIRDSQEWDSTAQSLDRLKRPDRPALTSRPHPLTGISLLFPYYSSHFRVSVCRVDHAFVFPLTDPRGLEDILLPNNGHELSKLIPSGPIPTELNRLKTNIK